MPDDAEPTYRWVVWVGPKGTKDGTTAEPPGLPVFKRAVPVSLPEPTAKELVELSETKANEVEDPLPAHFRYASEKELAVIAKAEAKAAKAAEDAEKAAKKAKVAAAAAATEPAEPEEES